jgi:hypothetical protein
MKQVLVGFWLLIFVALCVAQDETKKLKDKDIFDLNGKWTLDKSKSDMGLDKGPIRFSGKIEFPDTSLSIVHREPEIKVTETTKVKDGKGTTESIYYTDGRSGSVADNKNPDVKPTAEWKERKLTIKSFIPLPYKINNRQAQLEKTEVWEISKDGKTLTQTITFKPEANLPGPAPMKKVFKREK